MIQHRRSPFLRILKTPSPFNFKAVSTPCPGYRRPQAPKLWPPVFLLTYTAPLSPVLILTTSSTSKTCWPPPIRLHHPALLHSTSASTTTRWPFTVAGMEGQKTPIAKKRWGEREESREERAGGARRNASWSIALSEPFPNLRASLLKKPRKRSKWAANIPSKIT